MRKWFLPIALILALLAPSAAQAQSSTISMTEVSIDLWPEFDSPGVLVIYRFTLPATIILPVDLTVRIPADVGEPFAVAGLQVDGNLGNIAYTRLVSGDWANISFSTTSADIQIEYYDDSIQRDGVHRQFEFAWIADYEVENLSIQVQKPFDATDMIISPSFGSGVAGGDGMTYYFRDVGQLNAGQSIEISLEYDKPSDDFSSEHLIVKPSGDIPENGSGGFQLSDIPLWVFALVGAALIVVGVVWYLRSGRQPAPAAKRRRHTPAAARKSQPEAADDDAVYCHKCGKRAQPGDRFCRSCGTTLRIV